MRYSNTYLQEVVPPIDPPSGEVPPAVVAELNRSFDDLPSSDGPAEIYRRSVRWTYAVFEQYRLGNYIWEQFYDLFPWQLFGGEARLLPPIQFGLFDPEYEESGFGVVIACPPTQFLRRPGKIGTIRFPHLERTFVVMARMMLTTLHAPAQPANANSACWARDIASPSTWGFLTSGHAVSGVAPGAAVPLAGGHYGTLKVSRHPPVDAAFVSTAAPTHPKPQSLRAFSTLNFPAAGLPVEVVTASRVEQRHAVAVQEFDGRVQHLVFRHPGVFRSALRARRFRFARSLG